MQTQIKIEGLDCPNCAKELEEELSKLDNIKNVLVDFIGQKVFFEYNDENSLEKAVYVISHFEEVRIIDDENEHHQHNDSILVEISVGLFIFIITFALNLIFKKNELLISYIGYLSCYIISGYKVFINSFNSIKKGRIFDENFLMCIASLGAIFITIFTTRNELMEASLVMLLYQIGEYLQNKAVSRSRNSIKDLLNLKGSNAIKVVDDGEIIVDKEDLKIGDIIKINPGDLVVVDCVIVEGSTYMDTKSITGEANPYVCGKDDEILNGYINMKSPILAVVTRRSNESTVAKILDMLENSSLKKANPEKFITKFAKYYTPIVCLVSLLVALFGIIISKITVNDFMFSTWILRALSILVISCPCALIISVPLTYFSAIGICAKNGVIVKGANYLDELRKVKTAIFDKTGTLTYGEFNIININSCDESLLLDLIVSLEKNSNHPLAKPFKDFDNIIEATEVEEIFGLGLKGFYNGKVAKVGRKEFVLEGLEILEINTKSNVIYASLDGNYLGYIEVDDKPREELDNFIKNIKDNGICDVVILTGDKKERALDFKEKHKIDKVYYELLPEEKYEYAKKLSNDNVTSYIGDGVNDALVMMEVSCAFSMGKLGSDAAIEASDFILVKDDLYGYLKALLISKRTNRIVKENIYGSIIIKVFTIVLCFLGLIPLWGAVLADVGLMLVALLNSLRIRIPIKLTKNNKKL